MDETIIKNWNSRISPKDTVYNLGDVTFYRKEHDQERVLGRLNGHIKLILGNHDDNLVYFKNTEILDQIHVFNVDHRMFVLCHYPLLEWDGAFRGSIHLHGHSHNLWPQTPYRRLDIGTDGHNMMPWSLEEIVEWAKDRPIFTPEVFTKTAP